MDKDDKYMLAAFTLFVSVMVAIIGIVFGLGQLDEDLRMKRCIEYGFDHKPNTEDLKLLFGDKNE